METDKVMEYLERPVIQQYKSDVVFRTLVESVNDKMYVIPKYQRKYRWKKEQVEKLVESLLRGFPIPPISQSENEEMSDIIIGDNSSGKSLLLKNLLIKLKEKRHIYFIDAVNRGFDVSKVISEQERETSERTVFEPYENDTYTREDKEFIWDHIQQFHLNDSSKSREQLQKYLKIVIDGDGKLPGYEYNNYIVQLFEEKNSEFTTEKRVKICEKLDAILNVSV